MGTSEEESMGEKNPKDQNNYFKQQSAQNK